MSNFIYYKGVFLKNLLCSHCLFYCSVVHPSSLQPPLLVPLLLINHHWYFWQALQDVANRIPIMQCRGPLAGLTLNFTPNASCNWINPEKPTVWASDGSVTRRETFQRTVSILCHRILLHCYRIKNYFAFIYVQYIITNLFSKHVIVLIR